MKGSRLWAALVHVTIALALAALVLLILDIFNPRMGFLEAGYSRALLGALCLGALCLGVRSAAALRRAVARTLTENGGGDPGPDREAPNEHMTGKEHGT